MIIIGDIHGKIDKYWKLLQKYPKHNSIQVGDFGFKKHHDWMIKNIDCSKHKVNFGNHDYYPYLDKEHSLGNWSFNEEFSIFTIRGGFSIDRIMRTEGLDWFDNEELTYGEFYEVLDKIEEYQPKIIVSHDLPASVRQTMFGIGTHHTEKSITTQGLQGVFDLHRPKKWIFGHHHFSKTTNVFGTEFICLNELEVLEL